MLLIISLFILITRFALPSAENGAVVELNELEKELFSKVRTIDYYTTVATIKGLEHMPMGFYYFGEFMEDPSTIGYPVAMQKFFADTDIFLFWSYGNSNDIRGPAVTQRVINVVKSMGGTVDKVLLQRRFKYFPHVSDEGLLVDLNLQNHALQKFLQKYYYHFSMNSMDDKDIFVRNCTIEELRGISENLDFTGLYIEEDDFARTCICKIL